MKLGLMYPGLGPEGTLDIALAQRAESLGFHSLWMAEAWGNDAITPLAWLAAQTSTIKLGTAIMQLQARTPTMCAMQAMTVDRLSNGRMIVGLGPSGPQVVEGWYGAPYRKPLTRMREYIQIMQKVFARDEPVTFEGEMYQLPYRGEGSTGTGKPLRSILHGRSDIPIFTAAISPAGVQTAAEVASGCIPLWTSPEGARTLRGYAEAGFAKSATDKGWDDFEIVPSINLAMGDDLAACLDKVRPGVAFYVGGMGSRSKNFYNDHVSRQGWPEAAKKIQDLFLDGKKQEATAAVPDDLVDAISLCGPKERIAERIAEWREAGIETLMVNSGFSDPKTLEALAEIGAA